MGSCMVVASWFVPLGIMPMTPTLARTLVNSWKSWFVVLMGMGVFNALCRQVSPLRRGIGRFVLLGDGIESRCMQPHVNEVLSNNTCCCKTHAWRDVPFTTAPS
jgi:hypothetical protein